MGTVKEKTMKVLSFDDIPLHETSIRLINDILGMYKRVEHEDNRKIIQPIVHMYADEDTRNEYGELNGFGDALFFETRIYDPNKLTYSVCQNDSVDTRKAEIKSVKIFKDGSTMIEFDGEYTFSNLTSLTARKVVNSPDADAYLPFD